METVLTPRDPFRDLEEHAGVVGVIVMDFVDEEITGRLRRRFPDATIAGLDGPNPQVLCLRAAVPALEALQGKLASVRAALCRVTFDIDGPAAFHDASRLMRAAGLELFRMYDVHSDGSGQWQFSDALFVRQT